MNSTLKSTLLVCVALLAAPFAAAQLTLHDFTAFESPTNTFFVGDWELNADSGGSSSPRASFSQGAGFYNFAGGSAEGDSSYATYFFPTPVNLSGLTLLQVSAQLLNGNTAPTLKVTLFDSSFVVNAVALFSTAGFTSGGFTTLTAALTLPLNFDATSVASFQLSGNSGDTGILSLAINNLAAAAPISAVPEPSTYGLFAAMALLAAIAGRRFFQRRVGV